MPTFFKGPSKGLLRPRGVSFAGGGDGDEGDKDDGDPDEPGEFGGVLAGGVAGTGPVVLGALHSLHFWHSLFQCVALQDSTWHVQATFFFEAFSASVVDLFVTSFVSAVICLVSWSFAEGRASRGSPHVSQKRCQGRLPSPQVLQYQI